ncbi:origin recognition complex subunit 3 N-terminus-domain-containing protein [Flammula alnicola]|nr:origin recognition complex subunit 3 N-terminus-domain-containing protein [Flammula alnicola]
MKVDEGIPNADDVSKTTFCIPYKPKDEADDTPSEIHFVPRSIYEERDLVDGQELRFVAYKAAWKKCLERVQKIVYELQSSSVKSVVQEVRASYLNILPGLPYPELPVVSIINPGLGSALLEHVTSQLEDEDTTLDPAEGVKCSVCHLYPGDIPNISTGMRSVVSGFVDKAEMLERVKRKPATSLANYDIKYLVAWYRAWIDSKGGARRNLVVVLHDFEQFDPLIMQDVFYICGQFVSQLPLVFLLSVSSPSPNYLNVTYPRATLLLLRVRTVSAPHGNKILQEILLKTLFDIEFQPDVMIGPAALECLQDYFTRYHSSVDAIFTIIQLIFLRHFSSDPLTVLVHDTPSADVLSQPSSSKFRDSVIGRMTLDGDEDVVMDGQGSGPRLLVDVIDKAREEFCTRAQNMRLGFHVMIHIQTFLEERGYKGLDWSPDLDKRGGLCDAMLDLLRGRLAKDIKHLGMLTRKLKGDELNKLLERMHTFFYELPNHIRAKEHNARTKNIMMRSALLKGPDNLDVYSSVSAQLSEWVTEYLGEKIRPLEECDLWDVWYTGLSPFPAEILNPSVRASLMAGLLRPHEFAEDLAEKADTGSDTKSIWELPDTSILFKRYLDSGKMINVYDWFESFKSVLDTQRTHLKELAQRTETPSPRKRGKGKAKAQQPIENTEEDDEKWNIEVQARFIRALHELDYLGFIKHTGRKADHVLRTVFDIDDAE